MPIPIKNHVYLAMLPTTYSGFELCAHEGDREGSNLNLGGHRWHCWIYRFRLGWGLGLGWLQINQSMSSRLPFAL